MSPVLLDTVSHIKHQLIIVVNLADTLNIETNGSEEEPGVLDSLCPGCRPTHLRRD